MGRVLATLIDGFGILRQFSNILQMLGDIPIILLWIREAEMRCNVMAYLPEEIVHDEQRLPDMF